MSPSTRRSSLAADPSRLVQTCLGALSEVPLLIVAALALWAGDAFASGPRQLLPLVLRAAIALLGTVLLIARWGKASRRGGLALVAFIIGYTAADRMYRPDFPPDHIARVVQHRKIELDCRMAGEPEIRFGGARLHLAAIRVDDGSGWRAVHGQIILTVRQLRRVWQPGDTLRLRLALRRPRNFGNPGEFDYEGYLARQDTYITAYARDDTSFQPLHTAAFAAPAALSGWRRGVAAVFAEALPAPQANVLQALILGSNALPPDLREAFSRAGVSHVLSISGLHIGLVAAAGYLLFRWLLARSRWLLLKTNVPKVAAGLSVGPVLLYAGIAGTNIATTRSVLMVFVFLAGGLVDRPRQVLVSLAAAAIAILLWSPGTARDISFQLSFAAVIGLVWGMERFWPWWKRREELRLVRLRGWRAQIWRPVAASLAVSLSAMAATVPLTALHFNQVSLIAPLANAIVVPLLGSAAVILGLMAALTYLIATPLAYWCALAAWPFVTVGVYAVRWLAVLPGAALSVVTPTIWEVALLYGLLASAVCLSGRGRRCTVAALLLVLSADAAYWFLERMYRSDLRVTFLSVGQGDSAIVEFPGHEVMVIDGGGVASASFDIGERVIAPFLRSRKIAQVDYLVLSHPQWDHYGGLAFLATHFAPREFWSAGTPSNSGRFAHFQGVLEGAGVRRVVLRRGAERQIGDVRLTVYSPPNSIEGLATNDQSLVLAVEFAGKRVLFSGDIEKGMERDLVTAEATGLASTVLKVPHHGSRTSSSASFLDAVAPTIAVASLGFENQFGFPHREVVTRYAARDAVVVRTDRDGAVHIRIGRDGSIGLGTHRENEAIHAAQPVISPANAQITVDSTVSEG